MTPTGRECAGRSMRAPHRSFALKPKGVMMTGFSFHPIADRLRTVTRKVANYGRRLHQVRYWPELGRRLRRKLRAEPIGNVERELARTYCERNCVPAVSAFQKFGFPSALLRSFQNEHPDVLLRARTATADASQTMGGGAELDLLYSLVQATEARRVVETGVALGWSSLAILSAIAQRRDAILVSVDLPYLSQNTDHLVGLAVPVQLRKSWTLIRSADREGLPKALALASPVDFAHYDSDKSYEGRLWSYDKLWSALRPGGVLMWDDISDNMAFADFCASAGRTPIIVQSQQEYKFIGLIKKPL